MPRGKKLQRSVEGFGFIYRPKYRTKSGEVRESKPYWLYYTTRDGDIVRRPAGTTDQAAAYEQLVQLRAELGRGSLDNAAPESVTFKTLFDLLERDYFVNKRSTLDALKLKLAKYLRPKLNDMRVLDLRKQHVEDLKQAMLDAGAAPASVNRVLAAWRRAMQLGAMEDPPLVLRIPAWFGMLDESDNVRTGLITYEQYRAMLATLPAHAGLYLTIAYHTGMRSGEIFNLRWDQVDLKAKEIKLEAKQTKANFARTAPIYGELGPALEMAHAARDPKCPYVVAWGGHKIRTIVVSWRRAARLCGIPEAIPHDLRRTAATNMRRAGIDEPTVMKIVGWKTSGMFRRYNIVGPEDTLKAGRTMAAWMDQERAKAEKRPKERTM